MANYVTLRKGQRVTVEQHYREAPDIPYSSLKSQSYHLSSVSMLDLRGGHNQPKRFAPPPPKRGSSTRAREHIDKCDTVPQNMSQQMANSVSMMNLSGSQYGHPARTAPLPPKRDLSPRVENRNLTTQYALSNSFKNSVSMLDLRVHNQPGRVAPPPPQRGSSTKNKVQKSLSGPSVGVLKPIPEQPKKKKTLGKFQRMQQRLQARLTGGSVDSEEEEKEEEEEGEEEEEEEKEETQNEDIVKPQASSTTMTTSTPAAVAYLSGSQTLPRKFRLGQSNPPDPSYKLTPVYQIKGPARRAPPPPKSNKAVYRRLPLTQVKRPAPPIPKRQLCQSSLPPPPPPPTTSIPTRSAPPPTPSQLPQRAAPQVIVHESITRTQPEEEEESDIYEHPGDLMPPNFRQDAPKRSAPRSPLPSPPPPPLPPAVDLTSMKESEDIYEIPEKALEAAGETHLEQADDEYTSMDFIGKVDVMSSNSSALYSTVKTKKSKQVQEDDDMFYSEMKPPIKVPLSTPPPLPPKPTHQPPVGRVPDPVPSCDADLYEECQQSGDIYETVQTPP